MHRQVVIWWVFFLLAQTAVAQLQEPSSLTNNPIYQDMAEYSERHNHDAFLVYENGILVYETYANRYPKTEPHVLHSGTKSFSCAIAVRAQMDGLITLEDTVASTITEWSDDPIKSTITIRQLLSLTSGLPGYATNARRDRVGDAVERAIALPLQNTPGLSFSYGATPYFVFSEVIKRKLGGENAWSYLTRTILTPLGISVEHGTDENGNIDLAAKGKTTAREWARYGQLILQNGMWNGQTLLDESLLRECFIATEANILYGLTWWVVQDLESPYDIRVDQPISLAEVDGIALGETAPEVIIAGGALDQRLFIIPSKQLVIVRFARGSLRYSDSQLLQYLPKR